MSDRSVGSRFGDKAFKSGIYDVNEAADISRESLYQPVVQDNTADAVSWAQDNHDPYWNQVGALYQGIHESVEQNLLNDLSDYRHLIYSRRTDSKPLVKNGGPKHYHSIQFGDHALYTSAEPTLTDTTYTSAGTYTWVCPSGVTSVSAVVIGGGGSGTMSDPWGGRGCGGGGGALAWRNNITVNPGSSYTVVVGGGATGGNGGDSYFINNTTLFASGGGGGQTGSNLGGPGGIFLAPGGGGGNGGAGSGANTSGSDGQRAGGGAGGYTGAGGLGSGTGNAATANSGGGGGGSQDVAGGGVGFIGRGDSGAAGGKGGSGGANGNPNDGWGVGGTGGAYGGGGGGGYVNNGNWGERGGYGAVGAVRLFYNAPGRSYPDNALAANSTLAGSNFTIQFWMMLHRNDGTEHYVMGKGGQAARTSGTGWVVYISTTYNLGFYDAQGNTSTQTTTAFTRDKWYHIAIVREGTGSNQLKIYVDGTLDATGTAGGTYTVTSALYIGRDRVNTAGTYFGGKLCDLHLNRTAVYTANFTRPTAPISPPADLVIKHSASEPWLPLSPNLQPSGITLINTGDYISTVPITPFDNYSIDRWAEVGYSSMAMNYDGMLHIRNHDSLNFGTGAFTIECWITNNTYGGAPSIASKGTGGRGAAGSTGWCFLMGGDGRLEWWDGATIISSISGTNNRVGPHSWGHIAAVREGTGSNQFKMYVNGKLNATGTVSTNYSDTNTFNILTSRNNDYPASKEGIFGLRVSKGIARYTAEFTCNNSSFVDQAITKDSYVSLLTFVNTGLHRNTGRRQWRNDGWDPHFFDTHYYGMRVDPKSIMGRSGVGDHSVHFRSGQARVVAESTAAAGEFDFGTGNFSIEFWANPLNGEHDGNTYYVYFDSHSTMNDSGLSLNSTRMAGLELWTGGHVVLTSSYPGLSMANQWRHICIQRVNGFLALYVNGIKRNEVAYSTAIGSPTGRFVIGNGSYSSGTVYTRYGNGFYGWMSNFRIVKGNAAYIANNSNPDKFAVSSQPLTTITGCTLLTLYGPGMLDYSGRSNRVYAGAVPAARENLTSAWDVYAGVSYTPFSPTRDFALRDISVSDLGVDASGLWGACDNFGWDHRNLSPSLGFIQRFSTPWTVEFWFYSHETSPDSPGAIRVVRTAGDGNEPGWTFHYHMNSAGSASRLDVCFDIRTNAATNRLGSTSNGGNVRPHGWNHVAIVYDPTRSSQMAVHVNGQRVATSASPLAQATPWYTNHPVQQRNACGPMRISVTARYNNDSTTYTIPGIWTRDTYDAILTKESGSFWDKSLGHLAYDDNLHFDKNFKATSSSSGSIYMPGFQEYTAYTYDYPQILIHGGWYWSPRVADVRFHDFVLEMWASWHDATAGGNAIPAGPNSEGACLLHIRNWVWVGLLANGNWNLTLKNANNATNYYSRDTGIAGATKTSGRFDHIALQRTGRNFILYINGVQRATAPANNQGSGYPSGYTWNSDVDYSGLDDTLVTIGRDWSALKATKWVGWLEDVRFTKTARYETKNINGVATMCHKGTTIPAMPTAPFPSR